MLETHIVLIFSGILLGAIYALVALGLTLIFGVSRVLNVAHGDFLMLGSLVSFLLVTIADLNPFVSLVILVPLFFAVGLLFERVLMRRIITQVPQKALAASIIVTVGLSMAIEDSTSFYFGQSNLVFVSISYFLPPIGFGALTFPTVRFLSLIAILVLAILVRFLIFNTYTGKVIRATIQDREAAMALGADVNRLSAITLGIGIMLAAVAGLFLVMITGLTAYAGLPLTVKALTIVILGGLGSLFGSVVGGIVIGIAETYVGSLIGTQWAPVAAILILIVILLVRPTGIFGRRVEHA